MYTILHVDISYRINLFLSLVCTHLEGVIYCQTISLANFCTFLVGQVLCWSCVPDSPLVLWLLSLQVDCVPGSAYSVWSWHVRPLPADKHHPHQYRNSSRPVQWGCMSPLRAVLWKESCTHVHKLTLSNNIMTIVCTRVHGVHTVRHSGKIAHINICAVWKL